MRTQGMSRQHTERRAYLPPVFSTRPPVILRNHRRSFTGRSPGSWLPVLFSILLLNRISQTDHALKLPSARSGFIISYAVRSGLFFPPSRQRRRQWHNRKNSHFTVAGQHGTLTRFPFHPFFPCTEHKSALRCNDPAIIPQ